MPLQGTCDGLTYPEVASRFPKEFEARNCDKLRYRYPAGGEVGEHVHVE